MSNQVALLWVLWGEVPGANEAEALSATVSATSPSVADGFSVVLQKASDRAFKGGIAGFGAGLLQVQSTLNC